MEVGASEGELIKRALFTPMASNRGDRAQAKLCLGQTSPYQDPENLVIEEGETHCWKSKNHQSFRQDPNRFESGLAQVGSSLASHLPAMFDCPAKTRMGSTGWDFSFSFVAR